MASAPLLVKINVEFSKINCIKKCDRNIKCICGELAFQILKIAWFVAALPWQLELHLYGAHIENFEFSLFLR